MFCGNDKGIIVHCISRFLVQIKRVGGAESCVLTRLTTATTLLIIAISNVLKFTNECAFLEALGCSVLVARLVSSLQQCSRGAWLPGTGFEPAGQRFFLVEHMFWNAQVVRSAV